MKLYGKYRLERITEPYNLNNGITLNGGYTMAMFLNNQHADYLDAGITDIVDNTISNERYIATVTGPKGTFPKLSRFFYANYDESIITKEEFEQSLITKGYRFSVELLTPTQAIEFLKTNTNLQEVEPGKFLVSPEYEMGGIIYPAQFLEIN